MVEAVAEVSAESTVEQLGQFVATESRRLATSVWKIGHALTLAKAKAGHGKFGKFLKQYFPQDQRTANRFMLVAKSFTLEECDGVKAKDIFQQLWPVEAKPKATTRATSATPPAPAAPTVPTVAPAPITTPKPFDGGHDSGFGGQEPPAAANVDEPTIEEAGLPADWEKILEKEMTGWEPLLKRADTLVLDMADALGVITLSREQIVAALVGALAKQPKV